MEQKKKRIISIIIVVTAVAGLFCIYLYARPKTVTNYSPEFEAEQEKQDGEDSESSVEPGIKIPGYKSINIDAGTKDVAVELVNPEENQVYFKISFYLPETDETIYASDLIKPGQHLYEITLDREMEPGEYPLTVKYETSSADENMTPRNGADVNCTLVVNA
ncbi:MAG: hypothetical protein PHS82_08390 [Lachnospiraceae bacterium]|nr:hypothetical protein [Lachnospiraceae bacterium]